VNPNDDVPNSQSDREEPKGDPRGAGRDRPEQGGPSRPRADTPWDAAADGPQDAPTGRAGPGSESGDARHATKKSDSESDSESESGRSRNPKQDIEVVCKPPPGRGRRRLLRFLVVLALLLLVGVVGVMAVLASDIPKSILIDALQKALGMRVDATSVSAGFFGHTTVDGVKLTIPLDDGPFVETTQIRVNHTALPLILFTGLQIKDLQVVAPAVHLRQTSSGRWNVADALGGIGGKSGGGGGDAAGGGGSGGGAARTKIPAIDIRGATLQVTDRTGRFSRVGPFDLLGLPDETAPDLVWKYSFNLPNQVSISGRAVTGGDWRNEAKILITDLKPLAGPFVGAANIPDLKLAARWEGKAGAGVEGRVDIESLLVNGMAARGTLGFAQSEGGKVTITPAGLQLFTGAGKTGGGGTPGGPATMPAATGPSQGTTTAPALAAGGGGQGPFAGPPLAVLAGGSIVYENSAVRAVDLVAQVGGGFAKVNASFSPASRGGEAVVTWVGVGMPAALSHEGTLKAKLNQNLSGEVELSADLDTRGHLVSAPARGWAGKVSVAGRGPGFDDLSVRVTVPQFTLASDRQQVPLDNLTAQISVSPKLGDRPGGPQQRLHPGPGVSLEWARIGESDRVAASGYFLPASATWALNFRGAKWPLPKVDAEGLGLTVDVAGDASAVHIHEVKVAGAESVLSLTGSYVASRAEKPLEVIATLDHKPPDTGRDAAAVGAKPLPRKLIWGALAGRGTITGTLEPVSLRMTGEMQGLNLRLFDRDVGNVSLKVKGEADAHQAMIIPDPAEPAIQLLGGKWTLAASHSLDQDTSFIDVGLADLPLANVGDMLDVEGLTGTADGKWTIYIPTFADMARQVSVAGGLRATGVKFAGLEVDQVDAKTSVEKGVFSIDPLEVRRKVGDLDGRFTGRASIAVENPKALTLTDLRLTDWPVTAPPSTFLTVNMSGPRVEVLLADPAATDPAARKWRVETGPLVVSSTVQVGDIDAGTVQLNAEMHGRTVHVPLLGARLFGSDMQAQATADLDDPNGMTATLVAKDIEPRELGKLIPPLRSLSGSFDLDLAVAPSKRSLALEPLEANLTLTSRDVVYRQQVPPPAIEDDAGDPVTNPSATGPAGSGRVGTGPATRPAYGSPATASIVVPVSAGTNPATNAATAAPVAAGGIRVGNGRFRLYTKLDERFSAERVVLADQSGVSVKPSPDVCPVPRTGPLPVNTLEVAAGELTFWGRMSRNENDRGIDGYTTVSSHLRIAARCIDLNQVMQAFKTDNKQTPGIVDGEIIVHGTNRLELETNARRARRAVVGTSVPAATNPATVPAKQAAAVTAAADPTSRHAGLGIDVVGPPTPTTTGPGAARPEAQRLAAPPPGPAAAATASSPTSAPGTLPAAEENDYVTQFVRAMQGEGTFRIRKSNLVNVGWIKALYNSLRIGQDPTQPTGSGEVRFRIEKSALYLTAFRYFSNGVEARAVGEITDLHKVRDAKLKLTAYGSIRTLKDVQIPIVRSVIPDLEAVLSAIQQNGLTIDVGGTLYKYNYRIIPFEELGKSLRELLVGDYREANRASPR
jgi:hypothetical protein